MLMIDAALTILARREAAKLPVCVTTADIIGELGWTDDHSNRKGIEMSLPRNGFVRIAKGLYTL
jgi:hypothetical protein